MNQTKFKKSCYLPQTIENYTLRDPGVKTRYAVNKFICFLQTYGQVERVLFMLKSDNIVIL